jgi:hypothetical protein
MKFITWDVGIVAAFGILLAYSLLIRKHKSLATLVSIYIAYVVTSIWGGRVEQFFSGDRVLLKQFWIKSSTSPFTIQVIFLLVVTLLLSSFIKLGSKKARYSPLEVALYTISALGLAVLFMTTFMSPEMRAQVMSTSKIVPFIYSWKEWFLGIPVLLMIFFGATSHEE